VGPASRASVDGGRGRWLKAVSQGFVPAGRSVLLVDADLGGVSPWRAVSCSPKESPRATSGGNGRAGLGLGKDAVVEFVNEVSQLACGAAWQAAHRLLKGCRDRRAGCRSTPLFRSRTRTCPTACGCGLRGPSSEERRRLHRERPRPVLWPPGSNPRDVRLWWIANGTRSVGTCGADVRHAAAPEQGAYAACPFVVVMAQILAGAIPVSVSLVGGLKDRRGRRTGRPSHCTREHSRRCPGRDPGSFATML
jgi:hypothetical protein